MVRFLSKPRLNYLDCFCMGLAFWQGNAGNWWGFGLILVIGITVSVVIERRWSGWRVSR
jgi:membrane glycosyltransferase